MHTFEGHLVLFWIGFHKELIPVRNISFFLKINRPHSCYFKKMDFDKEESDLEIAVLFLSKYIGSFSGPHFSFTEFLITTWYIQTQKNDVNSLDILRYSQLF